MLPEDLVAGVDEIAGPRGRSRYDHPLFPTDESVVEWVRVGRAERRDRWSNQDATVLTRNVRDFELMPVQVKTY